MKVTNIDKEKMNIIVTNENYGEIKMFQMGGETEEHKRYNELVDNINKSNDLLCVTLMQEKYVLDETKLSIHPQKELELAEALILKLKLEGVVTTILTNSPYFIEALEVYAAKYQVMDNVNWYLQIDDCDVQPVKNMEEIYAPFAEPFQKMETLKYLDLVKEDAKYMKNIMRKDKKNGK